jgi:adenylate cyclase
VKRHGSRVCAVPELSKLSWRELQVAQAYALGASYRQIASRLSIAPSTVRAHLRTIYRKLGVSSKVSLLCALEESGMTAAESPAIPTAAALPAEGSIAVLPFDYPGDRPQCGHFADGIVEDLTDALVQVPGLRVAAHTSAFCFRGVSRDIREIGSVLGVVYLVEGSVRCTRRQIRVTAQLIAADSGLHIWSEHYDRRIGDLFDIQDDIVNSIMTSLQKRLSAEHQES